MLQLTRCLPFTIGETWKRYNFRMKLPRIVHPRGYPRAVFTGWDRLLLLLFLNNVELNIVLSEQGNNSARHNVYHYHLGLSLCSDVFERRTSTGSGPFSILARLDTTKFVFILIVYNYPPKGRWIVVELYIYREVKRRGIDLALFTNPEGIVVSVFTKSVR